MKTNKLIWLPILLAVIIVILLAVFFFVKAPGEVEVTNIKSGQEIASTLTVEGEAKGSWFFEGSLPIKILDEQNNVIGMSYATAQSDWMTEDFVKFSGTISYESKTGGDGFLVIAKDNPSGLPENDKEIKISVVLIPTEYITLKVYFSSSTDSSCGENLLESSREILKTEGVARAALEELLKGTTQLEKNSGFVTSINSDVKIQSLKIENGTAFVDFDEQLEYQVGGSCRVGAIRAQIIETLKQFSTVENVIISINGRTEDILQP